jgi:recombination protein RecA
MAGKKKKTDEENKHESSIGKKTESSLDLAKKNLVKKYGDVICRLDEFEQEPIRTVSTGCISLDLALGNGGVALGRIYEFYGPYSSGKTTLALSVIVEAQKKGLGCMFIDAEHSLDKTLAEAYGVDLSKLLYGKAYTGEDNLTILEECVKSDELDVVVVDSVSALIPSAEAEADIEDQFIGQHARLMSKALRRIAPLASETNTLIIFINQLRNKITRNKFANPETTTGGEALNFYATGRISVRGPEATSRRLSNPNINNGEVYGHETVFSVEKNKLAAPFKKAQVTLIYSKGYDSCQEVLEMAVAVGIVDTAGAWFKYKDENIGNGKENVVAKLREDENLFKEIKDKVLEAVGLKELYERHQR